MKALGVWLLNIFLTWLANYVRKLIEDQLEKNKREREREDANKKAEEKLADAKTEEEVIGAGSDLLKR